MFLATYSNTGLTSVSFNLTYIFLDIVSLTVMCHQKGPRKAGRTWTDWNISAPGLW